jgi:hypothetical protein
MHFRISYRPRILICALVAIASVPRPLMSQGPGRLWVAVATGLGVSGGDTTYKGSLAYVIRVGIGLRFATRLNLEGSFQDVGGLGWGDYACVGGQPCPVYFTFRGASGGLVLDVGPNMDPTRLRLAFGVGAYRVRGDQLSGLQIPPATVLGLHFGIDWVLKRWSRVAVLLGTRGVVMPSANHDRLWFIPVELGVRLW